MICLDTNFLIEGLVAGSESSVKIWGWLRSREPISISSIAWYEFLCGPVTEDEIQTATAIITAGIIPFEALPAIEAARLFNAVNRSRRFRVDAMVAATSIISGARLATKNRSDFEPFVAHGLNLVP